MLLPHDRLGNTACWHLWLSGRRKGLWTLPLLIIGELLNGSLLALIAHRRWRLQVASVLNDLNAITCA